MTHGRQVKTDEKDAENITGLVAAGHIQSFPFLKSAYAELRYLVRARERLSRQRSATLTRLRSTLQVTWPEFEMVFNKGQPHTSKRGKPLLRKQLFMLAMRAVRSDGIFRDCFVRHEARTGGKKLPVVVAVARDALPDVQHRAGAAVLHR